MIEKSGHARLAPRTEDVQGGLASPRQRRDNHQVECGERTASGRSSGEVRSKLMRLRDPMLSQPRVPKLVLGCQLVSTEHAVVATCALRLRVVFAFCMTDEVNLFGALGEEERKPRVRRPKRVLKVVADHCN